MKQTMNLFLKQIITILIGALLLASCCCDDDDDKVQSAKNELHTGYFVDSPVQGLKYQTESHDGITDSNGSFSYYVGETITFSICPTNAQKGGQEIILGQTVPCKNQMSPVDLVPSAASDTDPIKNRVVTNISRLLQSLDNDGDLTNGIFLSDDVRNEIAGRVILFDQPTADFFQDNEIVALFHRLNTMDPDPFSDLGDRQLVTPTQAQTHLRASIHGPIKEIIIQSKSPFENSVTPELPIGLEIGFKAIAHYENRDPRDITKIVRWASSDSFISDFTNNTDTDGYAIFNAKNPGTTKVQAILDGEIGRINLHITPATLQRIDVYPDFHEMAKGEIIEFKAIGSYSNGYTNNISDQVVWDSSDPSFAFFSHNLSEKGLIEAVLPGTTKISAAFDGIKGYADLSVVDAVLKHIEIIPINDNYPKGSSIQFFAKGRFSDGDLKDITNQVEWVSYNPLVASVSQNGIVRAENVGKTRIKATHRIKQDIIGSTEIIIDPPIAVSVEITPKNVIIAKGDPKQFTATATYSDDTVRNVTKEVQWESSNTGIAIVDTKGYLNTNHTQTYNYPVTVQLTAILDKITGSRDVIVDEAAPKKVQIYPEKVSIAKGDSVSFSAVVHYTDGKTETLFPVTWWHHDTNKLNTTAQYSTDINAYSVSTNLNTALGETEVQVKIGEGPYKDQVFSSKLTVEKKVLRRIIIGLKGTTVNLNAPSPASYTFPYGVTPQLKARGLYSDGTSITITTKAAWSSSVTQVATINNDQFKGLVDTYQSQQGKTTIRAMYENVVQPLELSVIEPVLTSISLTPENFTLPLDEEQIFTAVGLYTDKRKTFITSQLNWNTDNKTIAQFTEDSRTGVLIAMHSGNVTITASGQTRSMDGKAQFKDISQSTSVAVINKKPVSLSILPEMPVLALGRSQQFTATIKYADDSTDDVTTKVTWASSVTQTAIIDNAALKGLAETKSNLTSTVIRATIYGLEDFTTLTVGDHVLDKIEISCIENKLSPVNSIDIALGGIQPLRALGIYSDYTLKGNKPIDITDQVQWSTEFPEIAFVNNAYECKGSKVGKTNLSASHDGITRTINATITKENLSAIDIIPSDTFVSVGNSKQFQAIGTWNDGYTQNITNLVTWSNTGSYTIENGLIAPSSKTPDNIEVIAEHDSVPGRAQLTVFTSDLLAIDIESPYQILAKGRRMPLTATLRFADLTSITGNGVQWKVITPKLVNITASAEITAISPGDAIIEASIHGVTGRTHIQITDRELDKIDLYATPEADSISFTQIMYISAIGTYSDNYTANISKDATWHSTNEKVAMAGNALGFKGTITPKMVGTTTIIADYLGVTQDKQITVYKRGLESVNIYPSYPKVPMGQSVQLTAIGVWSDYTQDLTEHASWTTPQGNIINFSNTTKGLVHALATGSASITVIYQDMVSHCSGTTDLFVPQVLTGVFKDGAVQGLNFETLTQRGITNSRGEFSYLDGEKITFSIKNLVLGSGMAKPLMTPIDLVADAYDYNHPKVITLCRLLQSIDINGYLDDGIYISDAIANTIETHSINLNNTAQFENDMAILLPNLKNDFTANINRSLVEAADAQKHLRETVFGTLDRIEVVADNLSVPIGKTTVFSAYAVFSKGYTLDVTSGVVWSASKENWVSFDQNGVVKPLSNLGQVDIIATYNDLGVETKAQKTLTILDAVPDYIVIKQIPQLNEGQPIALGDSVQMTAIVFYSDGHPRPESIHTFIWDIDNKTVASINQTGTVTAAKTFGEYTQTTISARLASMEEVTGVLKISIKDKVLKELKITPDNFVIPNGQEKMFQVNGIYSNGDQIALTQVTVHSESDSITTRFDPADDHIYVKAFSENIPYSTDILIKYQTLETKMAITISYPEPEFVIITPHETDLPLGTSIQLSAKVYYSDGSYTENVQWHTENSSVAKVDATGKVQAEDSFPSDTHTTKITASFEFNGKKISKSAIITLTDAVLESIDVSPAFAAIANGETVDLLATGHYSNGYSKTLGASDNVSWISSHPDFTTINTCNVKIIANPYNITVTITASIGDISGEAKINVKAPRLVVIGITPSNTSVYKGESVVYNATGYFTDDTTTDLTADVTWTSENDEYAKFDGSNEIITDSKSLTGTILVLAEHPDNITSSATLTVRPEQLLRVDIKGSQSIPMGLTDQFEADGVYTDDTQKNISTQCIWKSNQINLLVFDSINKGLAMAKAKGDVIINAECDGVESTDFKIEVTDAILSRIIIYPDKPVLPVGIDQKFTATGIYSDFRDYDITDQVQWLSSETTVATIDNNGKATAKSANMLTQTTITAHFDGITGTTLLSVNTAQLISISISTDISITNGTVPKGKVIQFYARGTFTDGEVRDLTSQDGLTWSTTNGAIVNIDQNGKALAIDESSEQVSIAALMNGKFNQFSIRVSSARLDSIEIAPSNATIYKGQDLQFSAQGTYTDGSILDITNRVIWSPSDERIAAFITQNSNGLITALDTTQHTPIIIQASLDNKDDTAMLTVNSAILESIWIMPVAPAIWLNPATVSEGYTLTFHATGIMTDDSLNQNLAVQWISNDESKARFANTNEGILEGIQEGTVEIRAVSSQNNNISKSFSVDVIPHTLESIEVIAEADLPGFNPNAPSVEIGYTRLSFSAYGDYNDGLRENLTSQVTWTVESGNQPTEIVVIDQAGNAQVQQPGEITQQTSFTIYAIFDDSIVGHIDLTITP
ncbi:MAG: hypothetical protein OMM_01376 [Candidatus Magnetoglobus multicellularis str. Araruama]|uniref:BIG2 domain-containing protein n=1 Tax=Candidatus Magnetoglobus multicellularis str. Araruama TaxID=890399 RepID=A0A1V1PDD2_9BACT|nr:MAG: hypothetical protein OMM_01376 [Candidatus Magnetoglobus multicellularis str. Araruama]